MKCLIYCPDSYLRNYWDHYLREQKSNFIFHFLNNDLEVINQVDFDRFIFCQEHDFLSFKAAEKKIHTLFAGEKRELKQSYDVVYFWQDIKVIIDNAYEKKELPGKFNAIEMRKVIPILFQALKTKKTGLHQLVDPEIYSSDKIIDFYGLKDINIINDRFTRSQTTISGHEIFQPYRN